MSDLFWMQRWQSVNRGVQEALALADEDGQDIGNLQFRVKSLAKLARAQNESLEQMSLLLGALVEELADRGGLDRAKLEARVERELAARKVEAQSTKATAAEKRAQPSSSVCTRCKKRFPSTSAFMTESGLICADCYQSSDEG